MFTSWVQGISILRNMCADVYKRQDAFCKPEYFEEFWPEYNNLDELKAHYQRGGLGDVKVKKFLNKVLQAELEPIRERRKMWEAKLPEVAEILQQGTKAARAKACLLYTS